MSTRKRVIALTPKQIRVLLSALRSTASLRTLEKDREYLRKISKEIERQDAWHTETT